MHMYGVNTIITPSKTVSATKPKPSTSQTLTCATPAKKVTQTMMSSFLLDSFLVDTMKKKERAKKKKEEEAKAKEEVKEANSS